MLTGRDIICISSIDWDFIWQGHQEIMAGFARQGHRVLFIENTGVRSPTLRDLPRLKQRVRNWRRGTKGFRQERQNLFVYSPVILPFPYSRFARWVNRALLLRAVQRWMRAMEARQPIVWTFLPTPLACDLIRELHPILTVYYCIDDLASSSPGARRIRRSERDLFRGADLVFVTSEKLRERAARDSAQVHIFPFGVDFDAFEQVRRSPEAIPEELRRLPRPIVGYVGGIHQWIDQDLVAATARRMRHASFVLIGPQQTDVSRLTDEPNVHLLGARVHRELPRYVKGFTVGIVPYRATDYTAHVYPTKLNEYLAMGIPVVATDLPEIVRFNEDHGAVVSVGRTVEEFGRALEAACARASRASSDRRIAVARENSWDTRIARMSALMEAKLAQRHAAEESWREVLLRFYRAARRRFFRIIFGVAASFLLLFHSPVIWWIAAPLRMSQPPQPADVIVVFAGGVGESGKAGGGYQERVKTAVDLHRAGLAPQLIFSSGYTFVFEEAEMMKSLAAAHGVPASAILLEERAANTFQNVTHVAAMLHAHGWRRILLVSSPYHMRRAVWTWRKQAPDIEVIPVPVANSQFYAHAWGASPEQILGLLHEYAGLADYWFKGWL